MNFITNDTLDIGIFKMSFPTSTIFTDNGKSDTIQITSFTSFPMSMIKTKKFIDIGTPINFLGFPFAIGSSSGFYSLGIYADNKVNPLLRQGVVAWKSDNSKEFLLDAFSYGGNSGSAIYTQVSIFGGKPSLVGMVLGHLNDLNFNNQVDINYGLARAVWMMKF